MVKYVLGAYRPGLRDWLIQRVSAIFMTFYLFGISIYLVLHPDLSFLEWHSLFAQIWLKIATMLFLLCVLGHAWVGIWTIFTDYVKNAPVRVFLNILVFFFLLACFFWGLLILWSV